MLYGEKCGRSSQYMKKKVAIIISCFNEEDNILPYENIIRAVDVCAFACKDVICHEKVSYRLFKNVYKNFIDQYFYDLQRLSI